MASVITVGDPMKDNYQQVPTDFSMLPVGKFGIHPAIQNADPSKTRVLYKAEIEFNRGCCSGPCCLSIYPDRTYFYVLENGIEYQNSFIWLNCFHSMGCNCFYDMKNKFYFDQSIFDQQGCNRAMGCITGKPEVFAGEVQYVCCCMDCPSVFNQCMACHCPAYCGDRVRVLPYERTACCTMRATCCSNMCGVFGPKNGQPLLLLPVVGWLKQGTAQILAQEIEKARAEWSARTQMP